MTFPLSGTPGAEVARTSRTSGASAPAASEKPKDRNGFQEALGALGREIDRGERLVQRAVHGGGRMGPGQLIALQAGIYRYSEAVDLSAKLVDRAASAVRTTLQSS